MRRELDVLDALRLVIGGPVCLLTVRWRDQTDVTPVIWLTPVSRRPPLIGVAVHPSRHTHELIRFAEEFALNIPGPDLMDHTHYFGVVSGRDVAKLDISRLPTFPASRVEAPLLEHCLAWIECGLEEALRLGDHTFFVGRVVAVQAEREAFDETWLVGERPYRPLHYLGGEWYGVLGERLQAQLRTDEEGAIQLGETPEERERRLEEEARERERRQREGAE
ncbi:MAG: flavin reductase family protein [Dehalococcoidia bacterium]|jgi:flavin reductase (DIM6/NTAB) family NADH-FMN oxidoreductase RutF|nr:flavin reductase family protein [Dehalococcoidia bacterium]MDW8009577.1 flavin reductase family protein [Chloroflexota bacterium]